MNLAESIDGDTLVFIVKLSIVVCYASVAVICASIAIALVGSGLIEAAKAIHGAFSRNRVE